MTKVLCVCWSSSVALDDGFTGSRLMENAVFTAEVVHGASSGF